MKFRWMIVLLGLLVVLTLAAFMILNIIGFEPSNTAKVIIPSLTPPQNRTPRPPEAMLDQSLVSPEAGLPTEVIQNSQWRDNGHVALSNPPIEEWEIYNDEKFGFRFRYPPGWYLNDSPPSLFSKHVGIGNYDWDSSENIVAYSKNPPEDGFKIEFVIILNEPIRPGQSLEEWRLTRGDLSTSRPRVVSTIKLGGVEAQKEQVEYYPGGYRTTVYLPYSHGKYQNAVFYINASNFKQPIMEEIFSQIIESFEFIE